MPNKKVHTKVGMFSGAAYAFGRVLFSESQKVERGAQVKINWGRIGVITLLGAGVGVIGGQMPDILEPTTSFRHRQFFHSHTAGVGLATILNVVSKSDLDEDDKTLFESFGIGYGSHLILDGKTPMGLPII